MAKKQIDLVFRVMKHQGMDDLGRIRQVVLPNKRKLPRRKTELAALLREESTGDAVLAATVSLAANEPILV